MGIEKFIDLGDFTYGEWIVYENGEPRYHVNCNANNGADLLIKNLLSSGNRSIDDIVKEIGRAEKRTLSLRARPMIEIIAKQDWVDLNLPPLPLSWLNKMN